jgi:hypothetical protein
MFFAHKCILMLRAADFLNGICEKCDNQNRISINDVDLNVFEAMFEHTYGKSISRDLWVEHGKELLHAARKFGFNTLSDSAES